MAGKKLIVLFMGFLLLVSIDNCAPRIKTQFNRSNSRLSDSYTIKAENLAHEAQYSGANFYLKKAIQLYRESGEWVKLVKCFIQMGNNYREREEFSQAYQTLGTALNLALQHLAHKPLNMAKSFSKLAFKFFHQKKDYDRALELYNKALEIELEILGKNHPDVAKTYNKMALVYWNKGDSRSAEECYNKSFLIKLKNAATAREDLSNNYKYIDQENVEIGTFETEKRSYLKTLARHMEIYGLNHPLVATIHENLGILMAYEGIYEQALQHLNRSLSIRLKALGKDHLKTASSYHNIGVCLRLKGDYENALRSLVLAQVIKSNQFEEYHREMADSYFQVGKTYQQLLRFQEALDHYEKCIQSMSPNFFRSPIYADLGKMDTHQKNKLLKILTAKAETYLMRYRFEPERQDDLHYALSTYLLASRLIDSLRNDFKSESYKMFFAGKCVEIFSNALETALKLYKLTGNVEFKNQALVLSEKSKAAALAEAVSESKAKQFAGIPVYLLEKEKKLKLELSLYNTYIEKEQEKSKTPNQEKIAGFEEEYFKRKEEYSQFIKFLEENYEKYYQLKYKSTPLPLVKLQETLPTDTAMVEYFLSPGKLHIFVITRDIMEVISQEPAPDFPDQLEDFYTAIKKIEEKKALALGHLLYKALITPIEKYISSKKRLIIIPHGRLYYIPFEALCSKNLGNNDFSRVDFLIHHYAVSYHYSANLWLSTMSQRFGAKESSFIGFAPVFSNPFNPGFVLSTAQPLQHRQAGEATTDYPELPATEKELEVIIELFKKYRKNALGYFHQQASEDNFKSPGMKDFNFIHIATHSLKHNDKSNLAGLVFSPSPAKTGKDAREDGILYSDEIYNLQLDARLVVLSSCESGVGKLVQGEGMIALARGFFYAGVQNIIFSLWKVEDRSTASLMIELYKKILAGYSLPDSLRQAKLKLIQDKFTAFPKYWSGFLLMGE